MKRLFTSLLLVLCTIISIQAQEWIRVHKQYADSEWIVPMKIGNFSEFDFSDHQKRLNAYTMLGDETMLAVPFSVEYIDSISFANDLTDDEKGHDKYRVFSLYITTLDETPLLIKEEWIPCHISLDGKGEYSDFSGTGRIRGRGNSTWEWYDKKPYRFKLDEKSKLLGLDKAKNWNLLANYRDVTDLMNAFAFEAARCMGMPHTNHTRFVEVFLNEEYIGLYQLTEKIEVGKNRVDIDEEGGVLLSFDEDDGPGLSPSATDNFWSKIYHLPMSVKHPDEPSAEKLDSIRSDFAALERAIQKHDYNMVDSLMDMESFIHILQLHEFLCNVELAAPRSLYMYKDKDGKYTFGPAWDWDAGYDFDWSTMYTGHNFFGNIYKSVLGTNPVTHENGHVVNNFYTDMFHSKQFVAQYKQLWHEVSDTILTHSWSEMEKYLAHLRSGGAYERDLAKWPLHGMNIETEVSKMKKWLTNHLSVVDEWVDNYPELDEEPEETPEYDIHDSQMKITQKVFASKNYSQPTRININPDQVLGFFGDEPYNLTALNADGSLGRNTAAKTYGAWFDDNGNTNDWSNGHVYVESDDMYSLAFGSHPDNCFPGHKHTVHLLYSGKDGKTLMVEITFLIVGDDGKFDDVDEPDTPSDNPDNPSIEPDDPSIEPDDPSDDGGITDGVMKIAKTMKANLGYNQTDQIVISQELVENYLGAVPYNLVALNSDNSTGRNTAAKTYGAWYDDKGDTNEWANGHVYLESDDMYTIAYGCHPDNCRKGHEHTVRLLYQCQGNKTLKVEITFTIE